MKEGEREVQLSSEEFACLKQCVANDDSLARLLANPGTMPGNKVALRLAGVDAERLRACLTERLATVGFQEDYSLTNQGQVLEELIDRFYTR